MPHRVYQQTALAKDRNAIFKGRCCFHRSAPGETMAWMESVDTLLANKGKTRLCKRNHHNTVFYPSSVDFKAVDMQFPPCPPRNRSL